MSSKAIHEITCNGAYETCMCVQIASLSRRILLLFRRSVHIVFAPTGPTCPPLATTTKAFSLPCGALGKGFDEDRHEKSAHGSECFAFDTIPSRCRQLSSGRVAHREGSSGLDDRREAPACSARGAAGFRNLVANIWEHFRLTKSFGGTSITLSSPDTPVLASSIT